jgi:signal transduction histidine kinase
MFALGVVAGGLAVVVAARWQVRRSIVRARLAERRAKAAERLAEIGAMTGGLAHEIKNPLSTIGLNAQLLAEALDELPSDRPAEPEARGRMVKRLASLRREVERLRGILTDFLAYAGEMRLDLSPHDVNTIVEELADFLLPQAESQSIRLRTELAQGPLVAPVDVGLLKQAILNLMLNAIQAMAASGGSTPRELILRTERFDEKLMGQTVERCVRIHVIDTGPGMAPEVREKLFTPYFTTKAGGTGLGLPTTRRIIESHQGRIEPLSEPGRGTDFVITLPIDPSATLKAGR